MKVLLINTYDRGGAAKACIRLHLALLDSGVESHLLFLNSKSSIPESSSFLDYFPTKRPNRPTYKSLFKRIGRAVGIKDRHHENDKFLERRSKKLELFSFPRTAYDITQLKIYQEADVVNLHWVAHFLDYGSFFSKNSKPLVWTLHDKNPFIGGEHYEEMYIGMDENGDPIERSISIEENELNRSLKEYKETQIQENKASLTFVALNQWMKSQYTASKLYDRNPVEVIPNGLDPQNFNTQKPAIARKELNLPLEKTLLLFVADETTKTRKGLAFLLDAFSKIESKNTTMVSIGRPTHDISTEIPLIQMGYIENPDTINTVFSAVDAFVIPSLIDNYPNTVLESLMTGTPVIGFPTGGIPEMIKDGENGILTESISSLSLAKAIDKFMNTREQFDTKAIQKRAFEDHSIYSQVLDYKALFHSVMIK